MEKVDHNDLEGFIDALKTSINNIAVEPISIEHRKIWWESDLENQKARGADF